MRFSAVTPRPGRTQDGFTIVEIVIAMLLLVAVGAGAAMAMQGSARLQGASRTGTSMSEAAQRVMEHLRSDRDWMEDCRASESTCPLEGVIPAGLLEDKSLGTRCGDGTYSHDLTEASAKPIDSEVDGKNTPTDRTRDKDGIVPDYFRIKLAIAIPGCDAARLGNTKPVVLDTALDEKGRVPKGSVIVEACRVTNQVDDRMSVAGCGSNTRFRMMPCPPLNDDLANPDRNCGRAWNWVANNTADPSPYVAMKRQPTSFLLRGPLATKTSAQAQSLGQGLYLFRDLPAGTYTIENIGLPQDAMLWETKVIPSFDRNNGTGGSLTVQPDVKSKALIIMRPRRVGSINIDFKRRIYFHKVRKVRTGMRLVDPRIPTESFQGDPAAVKQWVTAQQSRLEGYNDDAVLGYHGFTENGNCIKGKWSSTRENRSAGRDGILRGNGTYSTQYYTETACSYYKLSVDFEYYTSYPAGSQVVPGAATSASYALAPAPTFRDLVRPSPPDGCLNEPQVGVLVGLVNAGCVTARTGTRVRLAGISTGLNTPINAYNTRYDGPSAWDDDFGGDWSPARNETELALPPGIKSGGIWVDPGGNVRSPSGNHGTNPTFPVIGKGECYWTTSGRVEGSCSPCNPYIPEFRSHFSSCYVLVRAWYQKCIFFEGKQLWQNYCEPVKDGNSGVQQCSGPPRAGTDYRRVAANCSPRRPAGGRCRSCTGTLSGGRGIPREPHQTGGGTVTSRATAVGAS